MSVKARSGNRQERRRQLAAARKAGVRHPRGSSLLESARNRNLVICLLLAVGTLALYSRALGHSFVDYDDDIYVTNNSHVQAGVAWETVAWALTSTEFSNWHPLTWLSHALDYELHGLDPAGHHATNLLLHAVNVVLLFLLLLLATGARGRSLLVAALFAVHPFNVESVAWVAERKNVLSTLFFLLTLAAYGWYAVKPGVKRYIAVATLFGLALASKPMVITLPCVLLLLDFWPLKRIQGWGPSSAPSPDGQNADTLLRRLSPALASPATQMPFGRLVLEKLPLLALSAADGAVTIFAQRSGGSMRLVLPLGVRLENAAYAYAIYVWKAFWQARLAVFYPHPGAHLAVWQLGLAGLFLVVVTAGVWRERTGRRYLVTGWLWFLGTFVPVIGLIQVGEQAMADRYTYIPLIGMFLVAVWGASDWADSRHLSLRSRVTIAAIVLTILSLLTWKQLGYWRSSYDLWSHATNVTKDNFNAEENLGATLVSLRRYQEALPHLQNAARIRPQSAISYMNIASALASSGRKRDAIAEYERAIPLATDSAMLSVAYDALGKLHSELGNYSMAHASYQQALRINPELLSARRGLAEVEFSETKRSIAEAPSGEGFLRLGQLLQQAGRASEARLAYQQALKLDPKLVEARQALAAMAPGH